MKDKTPVPVIMYHSIGIRLSEWQWNFLTCPFELFEEHLIKMKDAGFNSIFLDDLYGYMNSGKKLPRNPVVITFDDGYLDNWIFAFPLLKRYGFKATIYINPEFTAKTTNIRKNLDDLWFGDAKFKDLERSGYLSWEELRIMNESGIIDVQSHSMTHTWYPNSDSIIDFRNPNDRYIWMTWNDNIERKPFLQIDDRTAQKLGEPVYSHGRAIGTRRFYPNNEVKRILMNYVKDRGGAKFFDAENWKKELVEQLSLLKSDNDISGKYESQSDYIKRINFELRSSKKIIETKLNKNISFLCWPGGSVTEVALKIANESGYVSSTAGKDLGRKRRYIKNSQENDPSRISRISPVISWDRQETPVSKIRYMNGTELLLSLGSFRGELNSISKFMLVRIRGSINRNMNNINYNFLRKYFL